MVETLSLKFLSTYFDHWIHLIRLATVQNQGKGTQ